MESSSKAANEGMNAPGCQARVSVCIPTYNHAHFIVDAVESVKNQTYRDFELVIVDNCSTDDTKEVVRQMMSHDSRIRYVCNETNVGPVGNLNRCLVHGQGNYITILCADDLLAPTFLEKTAAALDQNPNVSLVACARTVVDEYLKPKFRAGYSAREQCAPGHAVINRCLFNGNSIGEPSAVMFRKELAARGFNTEYSQLVDLEMWFHLLEQGDFYFIPEELCSFRQYDAQRTKSNLRLFTFLDDDEKIMREFIARPYIEGTALNIYNWKFRMAFNIWKHRRYVGDPAKVKEQMGRFISPVLFFFVLLPAMAAKKLLKIMDRLAAAFG
jgi:glycosyltransferase involved in cell wall biosynthesis